jgi:hypothetical protein
MNLVPHEVSLELPQWVPTPWSTVNTGIVFVLECVDENKVGKQRNEITRIKIHLLCFFVLIALRQHLLNVEQTNSGSLMFGQRGLEKRILVFPKLEAAGFSHFPILSRFFILFLRYVLEITPYLPQP